MSTTDDPKVVGPIIREEELVHSEKWLCMKKLHWTDQKGRQRVWETAERTTRTKSGNGADAVTMFCRLEKAGEPTKTLVISQYRPPLRAWSIEFPAGLIDEGETPEEAARRELEEETGYVASEIKSSYPLANDPGMTNTTQILCCATVDLDDPRNQNAKPRMDDEFIVTHFVEIPRLLETIEDFNSKGYLVDAGVYYFALALRLKDLHH